MVGTRAVTSVPKGTFTDMFVPEISPVPSEKLNEVMSFAEFKSTVNVYVFVVEASCAVTTSVSPLTTGSESPVVFQVWFASPLVRAAKNVAWDVRYGMFVIVEAPSFTVYVPEVVVTMVLAADVFTATIYS